MPQVLNRVDIQSAPIAVPTCIHMITLRHPRTGDEQMIEVVTLTNAFTEVYQQVCWLRAEMGLLGYQIWESQQTTPAF